LYECLKISVNFTEMLVLDGPALDTKGQHCCSLF
jgi:hypothetical protein